MQIYLRAIFPFSGEAEEPSKSNPLSEIANRRDGKVILRTILQNTNKFCRE